MFFFYIKTTFCYIHQLIHSKLSCIEPFDFLSVSFQKKVFNYSIFLHIYQIWQVLYRRIFLFTLCLQEVYAPNTLIICTLITLQNHIDRMDRNSTANEYSQHLPWTSPSIASESIPVVNVLFS